MRRRRKGYAVGRVRKEESRASKQKHTHSLTLLGLGLGLVLVLVLSLCCLAAKVKKANASKMAGEPVKKADRQTGRQAGRQAASQPRHHTTRESCGCPSPNPIQLDPTHARGRIRIKIDQRAIECR